jgi:hypothetical protein
MSTARTTQLDAMLKADLRAEVERLDALVAEQADLLDAPGVAGVTPPDLQVLSYHVKGAPHRGNHVRVVRCAPTGEDADRWMVYAGDRLVLSSGQTVTAMPWHGIKSAIRRQAGMGFDAALKLANRVQV